MRVYFLFVIYLCYIPIGRAVLCGSDSLLSEDCVSEEDMSFSSDTPIVLWHGIFASNRSKKTMLRIENLIRSEREFVYIKSLSIGDTKKMDMWNSVFMDVNQQVEWVCQMIREDALLRKGYHGVGVSQGAQFLRAVAQRCPEPPMYNLVSLGGQHQGYYGIAKNWFTLPLVRYNMRGTYWQIVRHSLVAVQNWHDPINHQKYVQENDFIADINNEKTDDLLRNDRYRENLLKLKNLVLVRFLRDEKVKPSESSFFGFYKVGQAEEVEDLFTSKLYTEDRLGLKVLHETGRLHMYNFPGKHIQFEDKIFVELIVKPWLKQNY